MVSDVESSPLYGRGFVRLNPCSNGIWSLTVDGLVAIRYVFRLNPCSNGIWSLTFRRSMRGIAHRKVLILVLMEYGL